MRILSIAVISLLALGAFSVVGCQNTGMKKASKEAAVVCPACHAQTKSVYPKDLYFKKHQCPDCKMVWEQSAEGEKGALVHACEKCGQMVEACSMCRKQG